KSPRMGHFSVMNRPARYLAPLGRLLAPVALAVGCRREVAPRVAPLVHVDTSTVSYPVDPFRGGSVRDAFGGAGMGSGLDVNAGHASSQLKWTYSTLEESNQRCVAGDVQV